ncbi:hypothetical protein AtubIFM55763_007627 [Aspergillus tubingensis]|uniref:Uncharacterized protein n=1 Tax=Aspergillus tubingensis TaxID=5068 RepID=A0A8H3T0R2_ASPTU|nr:uncharacterized protein AtWU_08494 [Aspergillus tubingensis]GFN18691.1 hypothetical protein AtWU_08494 [Aspergillus tubingensis]GLA76061.1 hypothetical protein AtubIFM55763_007627 [Aspergillus tubingensis]GLA79628.1 hypothetical protein AtubIFM56815_000429 [Aspergillus tubingensis]GLB16501.1 hypothetical protein AtubIFM61612_006352 [Aspergillus tubingensis]
MPSSTPADEKRQRKKLQNRVNQRARRLRLKSNHQQHKDQPTRPYSVHRWRVSEHETSSPSTSLTKSHSHNLSKIQSQTPTEPSIPTSSSTTSIPPDHLLHLITHNVFRALYTNKTLLYNHSTALLPGPTPNSSIHLIHEGLIFPIYAATIPNSHPSPIPASLFPTPSQRTLTHYSWIDLVPWPRMRENLIRWEMCFDHGEFVRDLVGGYVMEGWELFDGGLKGGGEDVNGRIGGRVVVEVDEDDDGDGEVSGNARNGWIVWGEPHCKESWEVTPGFLRKWGWVVEGCVEEVVRWSNYWRVGRGEGEIRVVST